MCKYRFGPSRSFFPVLWLQRAPSSVFLHIPKLAGEHFLRYAAGGFSQFPKVLCAGGQISQYHFGWLLVYQLGRI